MAVFRQAFAGDLQDIPPSPIDVSNPTSTEACKIIEYSDTVRKKRKAGVVVSEEEVVVAYQKTMKVYNDILFVIFIF